MLDMKQAASNLIDAGFSDDEIKSTIGQMKNYASSLIDQGKSDTEVNDLISKSQVVDKSGKNVSMFAPSTPEAKPASSYDYYGVKGIANKATTAAKESFNNAQDLIAPATQESNPVAQVLRPIGRAALNVSGKVFAPGAGAAAGLGAVAHDYYKMLGLPENVANFGEKVTELATGAGMPTGIATGGVSTAINKAANFTKEMALVNPVAKAVNEAGGVAPAVTQIAKGVAEPIGGAGLEAAGQELAGAQKTTSAAQRATGKGLYKEAISAVPQEATVASDFANTIREAQPAIKTGAPAVGKKLNAMADELDSAVSHVTGHTTVGIGASKASLKDLSPELQQRLSGMFDGLPKEGVTFETLDQAKRNIGQLWKSARTDDDRRLLTMAQNSIEADINKFGTEYPQAVKKYREADAFWKNEVAQYHSQGAPLRDLVEAKYPSEMIDALSKKPIEEIRNVVGGLGKSPDGVKALKTAGDSIVSNMMTHSIDPITGMFDPKKFIGAMSAQGVPEKLQTILGPEQFSNVQNFVNASRQIVTQIGDKALSSNGNPMLKTMGYFHLLRGTQEAIIGLPMALYQFSAAGTMLLGPKLMGQIIQTRAGAPLLAELMHIQPSARALAISQTLGKIADSLGAVQIPAAVARSQRGNN